MLANTLSILAVAITLSTLFIARQGYLRQKARYQALAAKYPHLVREK